MSLDSEIHRPNFILIPNPATEDEHYRERIASINGISRRSVLSGEVDFLYHSFGNLTLTDKERAMGLFLISKYISKNEDFWDLQQRKQAFSQQAEGLLSLNATTASYGMNMPAYLHALSDYKELVGETSLHTSLLLGVYTRDSLIEYTAAIRMMFPNSRPVAIDLLVKTRTEDDRALADLCLADGKMLPFANSSFDTIHTNFLFDFNPGKTPKAAVSNNERKQILGEMYRVLKPNGMLMLIERDTKKIPFEEFALELKQAGFAEVVREPTVRFYSRRDLTRFLEAALTLEEMELYEGDGASLITAGKP
jgi:hypothetical protein